MENLYPFLGFGSIGVIGWGLLRLVFVRGKRKSGAAMAFAAFIALIVIVTASQRHDADRGGFASVKEYQEAREFGIKSASEWNARRGAIRADAAGARAKLNALQQAASDAGFDDPAEYKQAKVQGISSAAAWRRHQELEAVKAAVKVGGFPDVGSYERAKSVGITTFAEWKSKQTAQRDAKRYHRIAIDDLKLDIDDMIGKRVSVRGRGMLLGEMFVLSDARQVFDTNGIPVHVKELPRRTRKWLLNKCNTPCRVTVEGEISRFVMFLNSGITAHKIRR